ncbi:murein L,D-transpeptidase catalytic domain family protein [Flavihumibacter sp. UBA7668]|uniref:murein L,D-transpeptidase catalytic domain family protein n=1 Tax=Flavihumibacter sp. UBA7668 TaxID=1946542 RepID=UPI0025C65343|nr:murein L,D-transpeptidase catalytic domain family protein [Flavihumibacter sp. UBA7668]
MNNLLSNPTLKTAVFLTLFSLHLMVPVNVTTSMAAGFKSAGSIANLTACMLPLSQQLPEKKIFSAKIPQPKKLVADAVYTVADSIYSALGLARKGLSRPAFRYAWKGYKNLLDKGRVRRSDVLSICDFSQSSKRKRLYVIDLEEKKLLMQTFVAHGRNSGSEYARNFSNRPESHQSSLGFYVTRSTYFGEHGLALKIDGLERGINDKASARNIVVHGSDYVGTDFLRSNKMNGRSFGCPAVPREQATKIIHTIKQGSCLFIYHPSKKYLSNSKILNV